MKKNILSVAFLVLFLISCTKKSTESVHSSLNYEPGFTQTLVFETKTSASQMGFFEEANEIEFKLDSIAPDSSYIFTGKVTRMRYKSDIMGEKGGFDTEVVKAINTTNKMSTTELELYTEVKSYLDEEFVIILDKKGNLLKEATFKNEVYADPMISKGYTIAPVIFPDEKLTVDYSWEYNTTSPVVASQKIKFTYTVADITADTIILEVAMTIDSLGGLLEANTARGTYEIDKKTKRFIKGQREMNLQTGGGKVIYKVYEK